MKARFTIEGMSDEDLKKLEEEPLLIDGEETEFINLYYKSEEIELWLRKKSKSKESN